MLEYRAMTRPAQQHEHAEVSVPRRDDTDRLPRRVRLEDLCLFALAAAYLVLGVLTLRQESWRLGEALWPDTAQGPAGLPIGLKRAMTWLMLFCWLMFAPCMLVPKAKRWAWLITFIITALVLALAGWWGWLIPLVIGHELSFNPRWIPPRKIDSPEGLFYDGECGLCHRWVKRVLRADPLGTQFYFAPLQGPTAAAAMSREQQAALPDSIVIRRADGELLTRSAAVIHIIHTLGGRWRIGAWVLVAIPRPLRDFGYATIARARHKLFAKPADACPLVPPAWRGRLKP